MAGTSAIDIIIPFAPKHGLGVDGFIGFGAEDVDFAGMICSGKSDSHGATPLFGKSTS
jgi:hypothetical protein